MTQIRRQRRKDARPDEIISAALREFGETGFAQSTLAGVARRAGVARTTIYLYFDSKEALLKAAMETRMGAAVDAAEEQLDRPDGPFAEVFEAVMRGFYAQLLERDTAVLLKVMVAEGARFPDLVAFYRSTVIRRGEAMLDALIRRGIERGEVDPAAADVDRRVLVGPALMAAVWQLVFQKLEPMDTEAFVSSHIRVMLHGLLR